MFISKAEHIKKFVLKVTFSDGTTAIADFEPFLKKSLHPMIRKYYNIERFKKFRIDTGFLSWGRGEMEISGESIAEGKFSPVS